MSEYTAYVASLAAYNNSVLHGDWIDITQDEDAIQKAIDDILARCPFNGEEWEVHDWNHPLKSGVTNCSDAAELARVGELYEEHGDAFAAAWVLAGDAHLDYAVTLIEDHYYGEWKNKEEWAESHLEDEMSGWPEIARQYFDIDSWARDQEMGGEIGVVDLGGAWDRDPVVHIFGLRP